MELKLAIYPEPVLRIKAMPIAEVTPEIRELALAMLKYMAAEEGIGLAAPQVGKSLRLLVIGHDEAGIPEQVLVNPRLISSSGMVPMTEGCLSFPGIFATLNRAERIVVEALDLNGEKVTIEADGLLARVILHEMDHLDGRVFIDLFSPAQRIKWHGALKELERNYRPS